MYESFCAGRETYSTGVIAISIILLHGPNWIQGTQLGWCRSATQRRRATHRRTHRSLRGTYLWDLKWKGRKVVTEVLVEKAISDGNQPASEIQRATQRDRTRQNVTRHEGFISPLRGL